MTKRTVIFKGQTSWFTTPEFFGDKDELAKCSATKSCDETWVRIARRFTQAKTKEEFSEASQWAQGLYHDSAIPPQTQEIRLYRLPESFPDEVLVVHEDLAVTGIQAIAKCPVCGRTHIMVYRPDKSINLAGQKCLTCASRLIVHKGMPSQDAWSNAMDMYQKPAPSYRLAVPEDFPEIRKTLLEDAAKKKEAGTPVSEEDIEAASKQWLSHIMRDSNAGKHMNAPVKLLKIVDYSADEFFFEVLFRDWTTAVVRDRFLKPLK